MMQVYQGKSVLNGIAIGKICLYKRDQQQVVRCKVQDIEGEIRRFLEAKEIANSLLGPL